MNAHAIAKYVLLYVIIFVQIFCAENIYCQQWKLYADSAKLYRDQKNYDAAIAYYTTSKNSLFKDSAICDSYIKLCTNIGDIYFTINNYDSAEAIFLKVKEQSEKLHGYDATVATIADKLARTYASTGDYFNAKKSFSQAKDIREKIFTKESLEYALSCTFLANVFTSTGEYDKAENLYIEGKAIRESLLPKDSAGYAQLCNNLANLYRETGRYEAAEPLALKAKTIRGILCSGKDSANFIAAYAISCTNLANLYRDMGQYKKAEALYVEAKNIRQSFQPYKQSAAYASSCNILADLYYFMERYSEAESLYIEAKNIREKIFTKDNTDYAQTCNNLANLYRETGNYNDAELLALEANSIWRKVLTVNSPDIANSYENLGLIHNQTGKYKQAENDFLQARHVWKKITTINNPSYTTNAFYLGEVYRNLNQNEKANTYFTESFNAQYDQLKKVFQFTSENEKEQYLQNIKGSVDEYESFYFSRFNYNNASSLYEINLSNRNLILSATEQVKQAINNSGDSILNKKYREWASIKNQLGALYLRKDTGTIVKIPALEEKANDLEKELVRNSVALETALHRDITWQNIQQNLKANEAAVEFSAFNFHDGIKWTDSTYYIALILRKDKPAPQVAFLFEKKKIDSLLNNVDDINALYTQKGLYDVIWKPAEKYLQGVHKIYFAPAADLFKISFAALRVNANEFLSDKYELIQLNTTASVIDRKESFINASDKIQLYGGIEYTTDTTTLKTVAIAYHANGEMSRSLPDDLTRAGSIQYLPATKTEVETIQQQANKSNITVNILSGINATEETFKALNGKASPAIIHIATHGFFFPDPKQNKRDSIQQKFETSGKIFKQSDNPLFRSGLLFAGANIAWQGKNINGIEDGIVTAYDVSNMYLPNTKLVVLSACETALGDIKGSEGVYGLQRAFKIAGVKNLVMSLWKVPDTETSEFMQVFYKKIFDKQPIDAAFFKAQTIMKNKYRNEPYKWAAWILIK